MKKTRARALEEKKRVFKEIIHKGREQFLRYGVGGFTLRALANELGMGQASLYRYFQSKRELWFAIVEEDFKNTDYKIEELVMKHKGRNINLIEQIAEIYFNETRKDKRPILRSYCKIRLCTSVYNHICFVYLLYLQKAER